MATKYFVAVLDTGNGELKIISDAVARVRIGGVLGRFVETEGKTKVAKEIDVDVYEVDGIDQKWVIGHQDINKFKLKPIPVTGREGLHRYKQEVYKVYSKIGLAKALGDRKQVPANSKLLLVTSTPARDALNKEIVDYLTELFEDAHKIKRNGERTMILVDKYVTMSETETTLYDAYLDQDGFVADEKIENQDILVINAGFGTTDVSRFNELQYIKLERETLKASYLDVIAELKTYLDKVTKKDIAREEIVRQLDQQLDAADKKFVYVDEEIAGFADEYRKAVDKVFNDLLVELNLIVGDPDSYNRIRVVGGAAVDGIWGKKFKEWAPTRVEIPEDPQFSTARGMYRYGKYLANELAQNGEE